MSAARGSCCEGPIGGVLAATSAASHSSSTTATPTLVAFINTAIRNFSEMDGKPVSVEAVGDSEAESTPPTSKPPPRVQSAPSDESDSRQNPKPIPRQVDKRNVLPDCGIFDRSMDRIMVADRTRDRLPPPRVASLRDTARENGRGPPIRDGPSREHSRESRSLNRELSNSGSRDMSKQAESGAAGLHRPHESLTGEQKSNSRSQKRRGESGSIDGAGDDYRDSNRRPLGGPYAHN